MDYELLRHARTLLDFCNENPDNKLATIEFIKFWRDYKIIMERRNLKFYGGKK